MTYTMVSRAIAAAGFLALAGCAQDGGPHPAYLGLSDLAGPSAAATADAQSDESGDTSDVLRHVQSNRVLSAMAFQKITGQAVDPDSLVRGEAQ
jgi:hypothetical protein